MNVTIVLILLIVALFVSFILLYNNLVKGQQLVEEAWSGVDVQLKRRHDLIPALVECVRGYARHEHDLLSKVSELRSQLDDQTNPEGRSEYGAKVKQLLALAEAYPGLKADQNFRNLQQTLTEIEDHLQYARRYFNGTVRDFNVRVLSFPGNLVASLMRYEPKPFFQVEYVTERNVPDITFSS